MTEQEEIQKCLNCTLPECVNCLDYKMDEKKMQSMLSRRAPYSEIAGKRMSARQRQIFELYMDGHNDAEISRILYMSRENVCVQRGHLRLSALPKTDLAGRRRFVEAWKNT